MKLCVIPARGGSKRISRKNIKLFDGKPIIAYSIEAALKSNCFEHVIVSTDDDEIANIAEAYGAEVPFIRPENLSDDHTGTLPVIKHAIDWFEKEGKSVDYVCCLYATAPFVDAELIKAVLKQFILSKAEYCLSVTSFTFPIQRAVKITQDKRLEMFFPENFAIRSQDMQEVYHDAGQLYWGKVRAFKEMKPFFSKDSSPYILPRYRVQDIDTLEDWKSAELLYQVLKKADSIK